MTSDSAGTPFDGRALPATPFAGDDGSASPALAQARSESATGAELVAAVARARLFVPVVARAREVATDSHGRSVEQSTDMALVTLTSPDGQRALPAFSSPQTLADWDESARPVPVDGRRAAQSALAEGCGHLVIDVASTRPVVLRMSMLWALAAGRPWCPAASDPVVVQLVSRAVPTERVAGHELAAAADGALMITLRLRPGLEEGAVQALVQRIGEAIAGDEDARSRVDAVRFVVEPA